MNGLLIFAVITLIGAFVFIFFRYKKKTQRSSHFIEHYMFHPALAQKVKKRYPHLDDIQLKLVEQGLRDYFYICYHAGKRSVAMPSQVVDVLWHEFILFTKEYDAFCQKAFGRFLHHTPTEAMSSPTNAQESIKRAWRLACHKEKINPASPSKLPLIFAIDSQLDIDDGFKYKLNCANQSTGKDFCAAHIACTSGCSGDSGSSNLGGVMGWISRGDDSDGGCSSGGCAGGD